MNDLSREDIDLPKAGMALAEQCSDGLCVGDSMWHPADQPPDGNPGLWSRKVVAVTNAGQAFALSYFHGEPGPGCWQRLSAFDPGERVVLWAELPNWLDEQ